jgi:hypothetical protein
MPDLTVSATIDTLMQAADAAAARSAIGAATGQVEKTSNFTAEIGGDYLTTATLTVTDPTPVQGLEFSCEVRNGTATIGGVAYPAPCHVVRSFHSGGWASRVDSQDASSLNAGTLPAARLPYELERQTYKRETFLYEEFFGSTGGMMNWSSSVSGGSWGTVQTPDNSRCGVVRASTGTTASANQRGAAHTGAPGTVPPIMLGGAFYEFAFSASPALSLFDGTLTGGYILGLATGVAGANDGCHFRSDNGGNWVAVTREGGVETATDTTIPVALNTYRNFRIQIEADRSAVRFYIDGVLRATHTTNIPSTTRGISHVVSCNRVSSTGTACALDVDWAWTRRVLAADRWS